MSELICLECGEHLHINQEWQITDRSLIGKKIGPNESIQGDYAHSDCVDGARDSAEV